MEVERGAMIDQPQLPMPHQHVRIARRAIDVTDVRVEPDDARAELDRRLIDAGIEHDRSWQVVQREVQAGARFDQGVNFRVRLGPGQVLGHVGEDDVRHRQLEPARELARQQLGNQRPDTLSGAAELQHVHAVVVRLDDRRQGAAFAKRRHVAGHANGAHGHGRYCGASRFVVRRSLLRVARRVGSAAAEGSAAERAGISRRAHATH